MALALEIVFIWIPASAPYFAVMLLARSLWRGDRRWMEAASIMAAVGGLFWSAFASAHALLKDDLRPLLAAAAFGVLATFACNFRAGAGPRRWTRALAASGVLLLVNVALLYAVLPRAKAVIHRSP